MTMRVSTEASSMGHLTQKLFATENLMKEPQTENFKETILFLKRKHQRVQRLSVSDFWVVCAGTAVEKKDVFLN